MTEAIIFAAGAALGAAVFLILHLTRRKEAREIARELVSETEVEKIQDLEVILGRVRETFGSLSHDALKSNTDEFLKLAESKFTEKALAGEKDLETKKGLIDKAIEAVNSDLNKLQNLVSGMEKDRVQQFGELSAHFRNAAAQTTRLQETTDALRQALVSTKARGQWGERMAEDVLRLAGFVEGVNYLKQKALETSAARPDYTFQLPQGRKVNMDVKFPFANYLRFLETENEAERDSFKALFLRDVRNRIKEVTTRDYINPEEATLDYVLVFIPNEQVYSFINQSDPEIVEDALKNRVILCSPFTLFAILAIIRQAMDNFSMERVRNDLLRLIGGFNKQWEKFRESMDRMGKKLDEAREEFQRLLTTRTNKLQKPLREIERLRQQKGIEPEIALGEAEVLALEEADEAGEKEG